MNDDIVKELKEFIFYSAKYRYVLKLKKIYMSSPLTGPETRYTFCYDYQ